MRVRKDADLVWEPYDPTWLSELARVQARETPWLADALGQCTRHARESRAYIYFVNPVAPNQPGSEWQFEGNVMLFDNREGELVLDVLKGQRVGGVEFLRYL